jgi:hypothetical protein
MLLPILNSQSHRLHARFIVFAFAFVCFLSEEFDDTRRCIQVKPGNNGSYSLEKRKENQQRFFL